MGYRQLIIARKDLNMGPGKLAAQVSHASMAFLTNYIRNYGKFSDYYYECILTLDKDMFEQWIDGPFTKTVCQAKNKNQLMKAITIAEELGLKESGLNRLIVASYKLLGLMSYLTAGEKEVRAWTIKIGTKAPQAAGKIHSDFEKGFIRADIVKYDDLIELGSYTIAKEKGKVASVGKDYVMQDGDVVLFKFNV